MNRLFLILAVSFSAFLAWIIYLANTGSTSFFFKLVQGTPYGDKIGHFILFGFLTLFVNLALRMKQVRFGKAKIPVGTLGVLLFVALEELSQGFIPARTLDMKDFIADIAGIVVFTVLSHIIFKKLIASQEKVEV